MNEPDDFGLGPVACLAHVYDGRRSSIHAPFWRAWDEAVFAHEPRLVARVTPDAADATASHEFESQGHVPIGCMLVEPPAGTPVRAGLLVLHGYQNVRPLAEDASRWASAAAKGLLTLHVRVRGFPGSIASTGNLTASERGYVTQGLDVPVEAPADHCAWIVSGAVADAVNALRVLHQELERRVAGPWSIYLHAESFGAAIGIIATGRFDPGASGPVRVARLSLATPSLGDWTWRIGHPTSFGAGGEILALVRDLREHGEKVYRTLRLFDAAVHARTVTCPALVKLATRDEVVPAPAAAAVFNALRAPTGFRRRFVVPYGHFEGGIGNARWHAQFTRAAEAFLDPGVDDAEAIARADALASPRAPGDQGRLFESQGDDAALIAAYEQAGRTLDDLAHTEEFEFIYDTLGGDADGRSRRDVFHRLHNLRKAGKLPRLGRAASQPPKLSDEEAEALAGLVVQAVGSMGQRDRLPYTPEFDRLVEQFNEGTDHHLSAHDVWRIVAKLAK